MAVEFAVTTTPSPLTISAGDSAGDAIYALTASGFSVEAEYGGIRCQSLLTSDGWLFAGKIPSSATRPEYSNIPARCPEVFSCLESLDLPIGTLLDGKLFSDDKESPLRWLTCSDSPAESNRLRLAILDIIEFGQDRTDQWPLIDRRELLRSAIVDTLSIFIPAWKVDDAGLEYAIDLLDKRDTGAEGVSLRRQIAPYYGDSKNWLTHRYTETYLAVVMVVAEGREKLTGTAGSLVVGQFKGGKLQRIASMDSMTESQRHYVWRNKGTIVGTVVSFVSRGKTRSGYRRPRLLCFLPDADPASCRWETV